MIKISMVSKDGQRIGFDMKGHAGFGEYGRDIVCAAVSALVINTVNSMEALTDNPFEAEVEEDSGSVHFLLKEGFDDKAVLLLDSLYLGLRDIRDTYGTEFIQLLSKEV